MFNPYLALRSPSARSPKPAKFIHKPSVYSLRNLTVIFLDLLCSLYRFQGSCAALSLNAGFIIAKANGFVNPFFQFFCMFLSVPHVVSYTSIQTQLVALFVKNWHIFRHSPNVKKNVF